ncbi:hypothetical protein SAMN05216289_1732 [Dokdonella immobilis]|uniref:Uncharacterized protein n=1 Tax=Dokdonella immobilis TaxID=578942 RepID=A0A1I5BE55_9GAMM|nr:hypothetical protein SAMN05216289_1732 [Dokdonella immobilis]
MSRYRFDREGLKPFHGGHQITPELIHFAD